MEKILLTAGQRFGRLVCVTEISTPKPGCWWRCVCDCGTEKETRASWLISGNLRSCGCLRRETTAARSFKHGQGRDGKESPEFKVWLGMNQRCSNPKNKWFHRYGGRGIAVCAEWRFDFLAFFNHIGPRPSAAHTIDRLDNDRGYEPGNVRWATRKEQNRNTRQIVPVGYEGRTISLAEFAERMGVPKTALSVRMRYHGCSAHGALEMLRERGLGNRKRRR